MSLLSCDVEYPPSTRKLTPITDLRSGGCERHAMTVPLVAGIFLFANPIVDVWSRKIVGWSVQAVASEGDAKVLLRSPSRRYELRDGDT